MTELMRTPAERRYIKDTIASFHLRLGLGERFEGDGDVPALWVIASSAPYACIALLDAGIGDLFPEGVSLPTMETLNVAITGEW